MKLIISISILVVGGIGSILGAALDHGNEFGLLSIGLGTLGSFLGIWVGYKAGQYFGM
jgi:membrane protein DedA with SNARE-associated domain